MLVDLHAHFPMHVVPGLRGGTHAQIVRWRRARWRARVVHVISRMANYEGPADEPSVTVERMRAGDVGVALSVLYSPFDEIDLTAPYGSPPRATYFASVVDQLEAVERAVDEEPGAIVARSGAELDAARAAGQVAIVHCVEGGFALGASESEVRQNVAELGRRGVAYVTLAHLFWRRMATNAPALPFMPDWLYRMLFGQPRDVGVSELGRVAVEAMLDARVLLDLTHMSAASIRDALGILDRLDEGRTVPVIVSHGACRFGGLEYNLPDETIARIAARGGVIGVIACRHYVTAGLRRSRPKGLDDSLDLISRHIDRVRDVTGSYEHVAIGSDLDGYIKPALPGLEHMGLMGALQDGLRRRYGADDAERICSANPLRSLAHRFS